MPTPDQLSFDGRTVAQVKSKWGDLEIDYVPDGMIREDLASLSIGDVVTVRHDYVVEAVNHGEKHDRQGVGTKPFTRTVQLKTLSSYFEVQQVATREEIDAAWRKSQGEIA